MKVSIKHEEQKKGMLFKKTLYSVVCDVQFSEEEKQIISSRKLEHDIILERDPPADVDAEKHANRGLGKKLMTAAINGRDANHFHLTINKLLHGADSYAMQTPIEAKAYEEELVERLRDLKGYLEGNAEVGGETSFEL
jgi:hypothetical protein